MQSTRPFVIRAFALLAIAHAAAIVQAQVATVSPTPQLQFFDNNGKPLSGGQLCTYAAGTTTPLASYKNAGGTVNTNPVILDSSGRADIWLGAVAYKFVLRMKGAPNNCTTGTTLYTVDNVQDQGMRLRTDLAATSPAGSGLVGYVVTPGGTVPLTIADALNTTILDIGFTTPAAGCAAAAGAGKTFVVTKAWTNVATMTCANAQFQTGGSMQPRNGNVVTFTGHFDAPAARIIDYSLGGTVDLSKAAFVNGFPEWFGAKADGATASDAAMNNLLTAMGPGHLMTLNYGTGCYSIGTTTITIGQKQGIIGPGAFSKACIQYTGTGDVIKNASSTSYYTFQNFSIVTTTAANGIHLNGATGLNSANVDISGIDFSPNNPGTPSVFSNADILLEDSFLVNVHNNKLMAGAQFGIKYSGGFNNTDVFESNEIDFTQQAGIYCNLSCTGMTWRNNVIESNYRKGIWIDGGNPVYANEIISNHFENNGIGTPDYDIYISPSSTGGGFNGAWGPARIVNNDIQDTNQLGAVYVAFQQNVSITGNHCFGKPNPGASPIVLGPAVVWGNTQPDVRANTGCTIQGDSGKTISDAGSVLTYSNLTQYSVDMSLCCSGVTWGPGGPGVTADKAGAPKFLDGSPAINLNLGTSSSGAPASIANGYTTTPTGRYFYCGVWAKTNAGTAVAWTAISNAFAVYTGSLGTTQTVLDTNWKWISGATTTAAADAGTFIACSFSFYSVSGATIINLAKPMLAADSMNAAYISTTGTPVQASSSPIGHTFFVDLPAATAAPPPSICDDCTVGSPTAGGGAGAFVVAIGGVNVGK